MQTTTTEELVVAVLDNLRSRLPDTTPWPEGNAYQALLGRARGLVAAATSDHGGENAAAHADDQAAESPVEPGSDTPPSAPPMTSEAAPGEIRTPAPEPCEPFGGALRPGQIPNTALLRAPRAPIRLLVDIERNAREGEPYRSAIRVHTSDGVPASIVDCEIPDTAGVSFTEGFLLAEDPRPGEFSMRLTCAFQGETPASGLVAEAVLLVNPDPRTLWKRIESNRDAPGWKPDSASERIEGAAGRRILVASQRGRSHAHTGTFRDDDFALRVTGPDGWNLVAVTDGAGSAKRSRIGSRVAAHTAVSVAADKLAGGTASSLIELVEANPQALSRARTAAYPILAAAAFEAVRAIEGKAKEQGFEARDYATTLLLAAHRRIVGGDLIATYWVGDGAICLFDADGEARILGWPEGGEYAGQTRFLERDLVKDGAEILRRIQVSVVPSFDALLLMTDGVSDPWFPSDTALRDHATWARLWSEMSPLLDQPDAPAKLTDWLGFWSSGNHDDRTLAVIW
jgi:hypothetical protein